MSRCCAWMSVVLLGLSCSDVRAADMDSGQTMDHGGIKTWYAVQGTGEPVILIHGWQSSAKINWDLPGITSQLSAEFQVITLDVRGHGASDKPIDESAYGPELVEDILRLMNHLKIAKAHIVGYSMGGIIAANFIAKHPDRVLSGTLGGMGWLKEGGFGQQGFARIGRKDPNARALTVCGRSLAQLALTEDDIKSIKVPMTVLVGDRDVVIQRLYVAPLNKARPDIPIVEIADAGHLNCILQKEFRDQLLATLKKQRLPRE